QRRDPPRDDRRPAMRAARDRGAEGIPTVGEHDVRSRPPESLPKAPASGEQAAAPNARVRGEDRNPLGPRAVAPEEQEQLRLEAVLQRGGEVLRGDLSTAELQTRHHVRDAGTLPGAHAPP